MGAPEEIVLKIVLITIHLIMVSVTAVIILFSNNLYILISLLIVQIIVYISLIINKGCLLSKFERVGGDFSSTMLGKKVFFLSENIQDQDFEKLFVGIPLILLLFKTILVTFSLFQDKKTDSNLWNLPKKILTCICNIK